MAKLGAVILPATLLLTRNDLVDRIEKGHVRHIECAADCASKFERVGQRCTCIVVGGPVRERELPRQVFQAVLHLSRHQKRDWP